jgi:hypothetical protein
MCNYVYTRNYGLPHASKEQITRNRNYLKNILPLSEHHRLDVYIDPGGNISKDSFGNIKEDINKVFDSFQKK